MRLLRLIVSASIAIVLIPATVRAQAITGTVQDTSGAVLPGVSVEAASPELIEKVRAAVTDGSGQYRIEGLRPGTYTVTFTLPGFSTVKREGIELTGSFIATVNTDMKVGTLQETIVVTGETPIVDVQSARRETVVSKDLIAGPPDDRRVFVAAGSRARHRRRNARRAGRSMCLHLQLARRAAGRPGERGRAHAPRRPAHLGAAGQLVELCRRHAQLAGAVVYGVRQHGRDGNGRTRAQHRAAHRRQQRVRQLFRRGRSAVAPGQQLHAGAEGRRADGRHAADQELRLQRSGGRSLAEGPPLVLYERQNARGIRSTSRTSTTTRTPATRTRGSTIPITAGKPSAIARGKTPISG